MTSQQFIAAVMQIAAERPTYRIGGTGKDGTCDCIGLIIGAINRVQKTVFPRKSTNYFARHEMATFEAIADADILPGMIVYKDCLDTGQLDDRYKPGGAFYNGDPRDHYHAGVVLSTLPLSIVHCTSGGGVNGITYDDDLSNWSHVGKMKIIEFAEDVINMDETTPAVVATPDGNPVKLRPTPSTEQPYIAKIPNGEIVQLFADAQGWAKVVWKGLVGYCMSEFLRYDRPQETEPIPTWAMLMMDKLDQVIRLLGGDSVG
jgi:hypothetical protein